MNRTELTYALGMARTRILLLVLGLGGAVIACTPMPDQTGRALFQSECSGCHGRSGAGDGEMAVFVRGGVPNLRGLSERNGGSFPEERVVATITRVSAFHKDIVAMPDFGDLLSAEPTTYVAADGKTIATNKAILDITAYLRRLQD